VELNKNDLLHLKSVAWGIVKRDKKGWRNAEDPSIKIDGRTLARLERMGLVAGKQVGTTSRTACVQATLTDEGEKIIEGLRYAN